MKHFNTYITEFLVKNHVTNKSMEYVDLGLPSGTKWATCNLGAEEPTDPGYYFAFGDVEPYSKDHEIGDWEKYVHSGGNIYNMKMSDINNKILDRKRLLPQYDAARVMNNDGSHMPTTQQFDELYRHADIHFDIINIDGIKHPGYFFKNPKDSSKKIFIPFNGYISSSQYKPEQTDSEANLWGCEAGKGSDCAIAMTLDNQINIGEYVYYLGYGIRPVIDN